MEYDHRGIESAEAVADIIAPLLGWDEETKKAEIESFTTRMKAQLAAEKELTDAAANTRLEEVSDPRTHLDESQDEQ